MKIDCAEETVPCRECGHLVGVDELPIHFKEHHPLQYLLLQGQLDTFDTEHGIQKNNPDTEQLGSCTSVYVRRRLQADPHYQLWV